MNTITKLMTAGLCGLALSACGGDGGDDDDNVIPQGAIAACFTVPTSVSFGVNYFYTDGAQPTGTGYYVRTTGPGTFHGQTATQSETVGYALSPGNPKTGNTNLYWMVTDSGVALLGQTITSYNGGPNSDYTANPAPIIPLNMQPGQSVNLASSKVFDAYFDAPASLSFVGLETLTLSGKTFSNVCHFQLQGTPADATEMVRNDFWYAPGYGEIQAEYYSDGSASVLRYTGDSN